jgi:outer membrane protein assembly factor BamB
VLTSAPAFADGLAFLAFEGNRIEAYSVETGDPAWNTAGETRWQPAVGDGLLFLAESENIVAVRTSTGAEAWRLPFSAPLAAPLVWDNGWLIAAESAGSLLAFRAADGVLIWRKDLGSPVNAQPALAADRVYAPLTSGVIVALDVATGNELWSRRLGGPPNELLAGEERIYAGSNDNFFYCINALNGIVEWRWRTGGDVIGVPVADDHRVYFVSKDNVLRGLDKRSGAQRWKRALPGRPSRGVVRAGDVLLVSGLSPRVAAFAMRDGTPAGDVSAPGEVAGPPYTVEILGLPQVVLVARDIAAGTRMLAFRRTVDPPMNTPLPALPNPITVTVPRAEGATAVPPSAPSEPPPPRR